MSEALLAEIGPRAYLRATEPLLARAFNEPEDLWAANYEAVQPWYICTWRRDHIYETCPHYIRTAGPKGVGAGALYPDADDCGDICGWCVRVWRSRKTRAAEEAPNG